MHSPSLTTAVRRIRSLTAPADDGDSELLRRFQRTGDEAAFAQLVTRHGPRVLGVCRRVLNNQHDAEDAFQATFLVLAKRARSIRNAAALGCWLHGVAFRVANKLRVRLARQPRTVDVLDVADPDNDVSWRDVRRVLDEEVNRLPERLRLPVLLCYFEGKTRDEAAEALGWKMTTFRGRLEDGRERLRVRLVHRGIELSAALLAISTVTSEPVIADGLLEATFAVKQGNVSPAVKSLAKGVAAAGAAKLGVGTTILVLALGATLFTFRGQASPPPGPAFKPPETPAKTSDLPADVLAMMQAADRVWLVDEPTDKDPIPEPIEVLKGMTPPDKGYSFRFKAEVLKDLPRKGNRWIVFLKSIDEVDHIPKMAPIAGDRWYIPEDAKTLAALRDYVPACAWGQESLGLRMGLHARAGADEPTVEVVLQNVSKEEMKVLQFRGNYFDDWSYLTFSITDPKGKSCKLSLIGPPHKDSDAPNERVLKPGERYIHVVRLNRWLTPREKVATGEAPEGLFATGGEYQVQAAYTIYAGTDKQYPWWTGKIESKPVAIKVPKAGVFGEPAGDFSLRLRAPTAALKVGDALDLTCDLMFTGKAKRAVNRVPDGASVELDGKWYRCQRDGSIEGDVQELAPGSEHTAWLNLKPDPDWVHLRKNPDADAAAIQEAIPFHLSTGKHTLRVAYPFSKTERAVSNAVTIEVASDGWGEPSGGVKARMRLDKTKFAPGEPLTFKFDLKNLGRKTWNPSPLPFDCDVNLDGRWYRFNGPLDYKTQLKELKPNGELVPFVTVEANGEWRTPAWPKEGNPATDSTPLTLKPGKHKVKAAFTFSDVNVRPESNTVEIEVGAVALDPTVKALALGADHIWVVNAPTKDQPIPTPLEVLKGPRLPEERLFDLRLLPGDDPKKKFIVFLQAEEEGKGVPVIKPVPGKQWYQPYTPETAAAIRDVLLPTAWSEEKKGFRVGLRLRQAEVTAGQTVAAELVIQNRSSGDLSLAQLRYNIYDYWPDTWFEVTAPDGKKYELRKPVGEMNEADRPYILKVKPEEAYVHTVKLNRWPASADRDAAVKPVPNLFTRPGEYTITAHYGLTAMAEVARWQAEFTSNSVKLAVKPNSDEPWGNAVNEFKARLRMAGPTHDVGEPLTFEVDLKNEGKQTREARAIPLECAVILDGRRFGYAGSTTSNTVERHRMLPNSELVPFMIVTPGDNWLSETAMSDLLPAFPATLRPGKHTLAASFVVDGTTRVTTQTVEFEIQAKDWGEPTRDIQARVRLKKTQFQVGEPLAFELDLKNTGKEAIEDTPIPFYCHIHLDGVTYTYTAPVSYPAATVKVGPGKERAPHVKVETNEWWKDKDGKPLPLVPGKHTLEVSYPLLGKDEIRVKSQFVDFEVVAGEKKEPDLLSLAAKSDRIVIGTIDWQGDKPCLKPTRMLKGPNNRWQPDVQPIEIPEGAEPLPKAKADQSWILFLKAVEDDTEVPKLSPASLRGWFRTATYSIIPTLLADKLTPAETGVVAKGLSLALQPRVAAVRPGDEVRLDVVLSNAGKETLRVLQQRYNVYDYWPFLTFTVTLPDGKTIALAKVEGAFSREDYIDEFELRAGGRYTHVARLDRWEAQPRKQTEDLGLPKFAFKTPGTYKVQASYKAPIGFKNLNPTIAFDDWPFWNGELASNTITIEVKK